MQISVEVIFEYLFDAQNYILLALVSSCGTAHAWTPAKLELNTKSC